MLNSDLHVLRIHLFSGMIDEPFMPFGRTTADPNNQ